MRRTSRASTLGANSDVTMLRSLPSREMAGHLVYEAQERIWRNSELLDTAAEFVDFDFKDFIDMPVRRPVRGPDSSLPEPSPQEMLDTLVSNIDVFLLEHNFGNMGSSLQSESKTYLDPVDQPRPSSRRFSRSNTTDFQHIDHRVHWQKFLEKNFEEPGHDLIPVPFGSFWSSPFVSRQLPETIHRWRQALLEKFDKLNVRCSKKRMSSLIFLPHPFVIPGGRFREAYYWDTYWTCLGLNLCGRTESCEGMIENFAHMVRTLGFVPNGNRVYYNTRSQPPMLTEMVLSFLSTKVSQEPMVLQHREPHQALLEHVSGIVGKLEPKMKEWLEELLPVLVTEYNWWMHNRKVEFKHTSGAAFALNRYCVVAEGPRPEMHQADIHATEGMNEADSLHIWSRIQTACESGWDFSSRWDSSDLDPVVPVDLNCILHRVELLLAAFAGADTARGRHFIAAAAQRRNAVRELMWKANGDKGGLWVDIWRPDTGAEYLGGREYASDYWPLWGVIASRQEAAEAVQRLRNSSLLTAAGLATSSVQGSDEQWDWPNIWAPLQHVVVEGLRIYGYQSLSKDLAARFLITCLRTYLRDGHMYEKYAMQVFNPASPNNSLSSNPDTPVMESSTTGGGGEYSVQVGFGWTNGVCLDFMDRLNNHELQKVVDVVETETGWDLVRRMVKGGANPYSSKRQDSTGKRIEAGTPTKS